MYCAFLLSYVVVKIQTSFRVIVPCFLATLNLSWFTDSSVFSSSGGRRRFVYKGMKRFIVLVSRDIPALWNQRGGGKLTTPRLFIAFNSISSRAQSSPANFSPFIFFTCTTSTYKKKSKEKKARERKRGRKRKCIEMSYNKSKQLPVNFRHASRSSNATPQSRTIRGSTISDLWSFPDSLSLPFATNNETLTWNFRNGFIVNDSVNERWQA